MNEEEEDEEKMEAYSSDSHDFCRACRSFAGIC